jgi:GT2 family glycosyltransferase
VVEAGFLQPLVRALEDDLNAGMAVSKILSYGQPDDVLYVGAASSFSDAALREEKGPVWHVMPTPELLRREAPYETDVATGCALLVRADVMRDLGGFDERYFAYFEDADFSLRAAAVGLRRLVVPASRVRHKEGRSTGGVLSPTALFYLVRNTWLLAAAHAPAGRGPHYYRAFAGLYLRVAFGLLSRSEDKPRNLERSLAILAAFQCVRSRRFGRREERGASDRCLRWCLSALRPLCRLLRSVGGRASPSRRAATT